MSYRDVGDLRLKVLININVLLLHKCFQWLQNVFLGWLQDWEEEVIAIMQQEWTDLFDRGGLFHCNIDFYHFLYCKVVKKMAIKDEEGSLKNGFVDRAKNEEVQFW